MKVTGSAVLNAPRDEAWAALIDPEVLVRTIPGCQQLEQLEPDRYRATVRAGVASIKGVFSGEVRLTDQVEPESLLLKASGAGGPGTVSADVTVRLTEIDGGVTRLDYDADAIVGGMLGGVGQRMLTSVATKTANEFFSAVDDVLTGRVELAAPIEAVPGVMGAPIGTVPETGSSDGQVFTAPPRQRQAAPVSVVLGAAVVGGLIALAGVLIGWLIAQ